MKKRWIGALLTMWLAAIALTSLADSEGVIVNSSGNIVQSGDYYLVYCYAQVHNNSSEIICLEEGSFELHSGEQLLASQPVTQLWPYFINPGEDGYIFDVVAFEPNEYGEPVVPSVTDILYEIQYMTVDEQFAGYDLAAEAEIVCTEDGDTTVVCRITNGNGFDAYDPTIAFGLYAQDGWMVYADGVTLQRVGIPAGGTMLVRFQVDEELVTQWNNAGKSAAEVRVSAMFRNDED